MSENKMDRMLREMKGQNEVPTFFSDGVDEVLKRLPEQSSRKLVRNKKKPWLYSSITAAALSACIIGSGFVSPVVANVLKEVPVIGSIFSNIEDPVLQQMANQGFINEVQKEATDKGITLSVQEVFFDGARLAIGYELTMPEKHDPIATIERGQGVPLQFSATLNGEDNLQYMADFEQHPIEGNRYMGKIDMYIDIIGKPASPLMMQLHVQQIDDVNGNWAFQFPLENENVLHETVPFTPDAVSDLKDVTISLEEVVFTPATTQLTFKKTGSEENLDNVGIFILDENGTILGGITAGEPPEQDADGTVSMIEKASFDAMEQVPSRLKVALVETKMASSNKATEKIYSIGVVDKNLPYIIPIGKDSSITVTDVHFDQDKTYVYLQIDGEPLLQNQYLTLNSNGKTYVRLANPVAVAGETNMYVVEYPAIPAENGVTLTTIVQEEDWNREWKVFEVPLNN